MATPIYVHDNALLTNELMQAALKKRAEKFANDKETAVVQWCDYEEIDWERVLNGQLRSSAYCVRKGLIRKAQFALVVEHYAAKHPDAPLTLGVPEGYAVTLHHPDDVDEALCELPYEVVVNEEKVPWILKLSMVEGAKEALVFNDVQVLKDSLNEMSDDLREFVVQKYIPNPLLYGGRKFSLRVYVLCVGDLQVFLCREMYAFVCIDQYNDYKDDLSHKFAHITNWGVNRKHSTWTEAEHCPRLDDMKEFSTEQIATIRDEIAKVAGDMFACIHAQPSLFFPLPGCFELFGIDFMVTDDMKVKLLEINGGPYTGHVGDLHKERGVQMYDDIFSMVLDPFYGPDAKTTQETGIGRFDALVTTHGSFDKLIYSKRTEYRYQTQVTMSFTGEEDEGNEADPTSLQWSGPQDKES